MDLTGTLLTVRAWPLENQLALLFSLWDQIGDAGWHPGPTDDLIAELDGRLSAHEADPTRVVTWDQIIEDVRRPRS